MQAETDNRATTPPRPRDPCYPCRSYTPTDLPYLYNTTGHTINTGWSNQFVELFIHDLALRHVRTPWVLTEDLGSLSGVY